MFSALDEKHEARTSFILKLLREAKELKLPFRTSFYLRDPKNIDRLSSRQLRYLIGMIKEKKQKDLINS